MEEDLEMLSDHLDEFSQRTQKVIKKVHDVFNLNLSVKVFNDDKPEFYNAYYQKYLNSAKSFIVQSLNSLSSQLQRLNLIPPVQVYTYNWSTIDEALTKIENKINQY